MSQTTGIAVVALAILAMQAPAKADVFGQVLRSSAHDRAHVVRLPEQDSTNDEAPVPPSPGALADEPVMFGPACADGVCSINDHCDDCCTDACDSCCQPKRKCCCCPKPGIIAFGEALYLQPTDVDFTYAIPRNGLAPAGPVGTADPDYNLGYRVGAGFSPDGWQSLIASYTWFESATIDEVQVAPGGNIGSLVIHPATASAASVFLRATATYDIDFELADATYRAIVGRGPRAELGVSGGLRYARLEENASVLHDLTGFTPTTVTTDLDFNGVGIRIGADGRRECGLGVMVYAKGGASFIAGEYAANYDQINALNVVEATSALEDDRIVTILEYELGVGWVSPCERVNVGVGYYFAGWQNALPTNSYIQAVQAANFVDISDTITFSGLVGHAEVRF